MIFSFLSTRKIKEDHVVMDKDLSDSDYRHTNVMKRPILVFWFDAPPRAGAGAFKVVSERWGSDVHYFCENNLREERKTGGWREANHGKAKITILSKLSNPEEFLMKFENKSPNAIHIFNGFRSKTSKYLDVYINYAKEPRIAIWSERPGIYGSKAIRVAKKLFHPIIHRMYYLKYSKKIKALIPLGKSGVEEFSKYGWNRNMMFSFMYDPPMTCISSKIVKWEKDKPIKLLYVGRFARSTKGIDILINSINNLQSDNWKLSLVGGYGEYKDFTINWANSHKNVDFLGAWASDQVTEKISSYDLVIVPSRFDGWNVVVNEALRAGVGVIVSNEAVSNELIEASKAGMVVISGDVRDLTEAISSVLNKPEVVNTWKEIAKNYSSRITSEVVGSYLIEILDYIFIDNSKNRPICPWQ